MNMRNETTSLRPENEPAIVTLSVTLQRGLHCEDDWMAEIELPNSATLDEFHGAIQAAVGFDYDHLYCFFVSRTNRSRDRVYFDHENELVFSTTLADRFPLPKGRSLFYLFDWRDEWVFKISKSRKALHAPVDGATYPRVVNQLGTKPEQYPGFKDD